MSRRRAAVDMVACFVIGLYALRYKVADGVDNQDMGSGLAGGLLIVRVYSGV
jgi:ABC-type proline/glycine betaine transport system permease subunit